MVGESQQQEAEAAGHTVSTVEKQRSMKNAWLTSSLNSPGAQPREPQLL